MRIGPLAQVTGVPVQTIRFYEREGLLPPAERTRNNYRAYTAAHVERLAFIRHCRNLDMALGEIRSLLHFRDSPSEDCGAINELLDQHIGHVALRIRELRALEKQLKSLRAQCAAPHAMHDCGILNGIDSAASATASPPTPPHRRWRGAH